MTACTWVLSAHTHPDTPSTTYSPSINTTTDLSTHTNRSDNTHKMTDSYSHTHIENLQHGGSLCPSHEEVVYSGDADRYTYTGKLCAFVCVLVCQKNRLQFRKMINVAQCYLYSFFLTFSFNNNWASRANSEDGLLTHFQPHHPAHSKSEHIISYIKEIMFHQFDQPHHERQLFTDPTFHSDF